MVDVRIVVVYPYFSGAAAGNSTTRGEAELGELMTYGYELLSTVLAPLPGDVSALIYTLAKHD